MSVIIQWLGHASFRISNQVVIYIDPWKIDEDRHDGKLVLVSHSHYDHYSPGDIVKIEAPGATLIAPSDVIAQQGGGETITPGQTLTVDSIPVTAVPAYNPSKQYHPQSKEWVGFIVELDGRRIYYAGDTDLIPEMSDLSRIDLALLPVGGTYTMDAQEAAQAVEIFRPDKVLPYHWGDIVGSQHDADVFSQVAASEVLLLKPGESVTL